MRRFKLVRHEDVHGVSGTGVVAEGCMFDNGLVAMTWLTAFSSVGMYLNIESVIQIHGHEGRTVIEWVDQEPSYVMHEPRDD